MDQNQAISCKSASLEVLTAAFYGRKPISGIEFIGTHYGPHNDDLCSGYLLQKTPQGRSQFPGIENATFGPIGVTKLREKKLLGKEGFFLALQNGILLIGIGNGPLDEHGDRENKISCTDLVVKLLFLFKEKDDRKIYWRLVQYVNFEDGNGDNTIQCLNKVREENGSKLTKEETQVLTKLQPGSFAQNLKKGFEAANGDEKKQLKQFALAYYFFENEIDQAKMFLEAEKAYDKTPKKLMSLTIPSKMGHFVLLDVLSDMPCMNKVVHSMWRTNRLEKLGILFLHNSKGQFALFPHAEISVDEMREVIKLLRQKVHMERYKGDCLRFSELGIGEYLNSVPEIYFDENTGIISNGSKVDPDVHGLLGKELFIEDIFEAVQIGLDTSFFAEKCKNECIKGRCWLYNYGLQRCHDVRSAEKTMPGRIGFVLNNKR